jgi:hypothetical protein
VVRAGQLLWVSGSRPGVVPVNGDWSNKNNWLDSKGKPASPATSLTLVFDTALNVMGTVAANANSVDDMAGLQIGSIIISHYKGIVSINNNLTILGSGRGLALASSMASGTIGGDAAITISADLFSWTDGFWGDDIALSIAKKATFNISNNAEFFNGVMENYGTVNQPTLLMVVGDPNNLFNTTPVTNYAGPTYNFTGYSGIKHLTCTI